MRKKLDNESTLLEALKVMQPQASTNVLRKMLTNQRITVDGETIHRAKHTVTEGQTVEIHPKPKISIEEEREINAKTCLLYTSPSPRDRQKSRMPSSA